MASLRIGHRALHLGIRLGPRLRFAIIGPWRRSLDEDRGIPAENPLLRSFGKRKGPQPFDFLAYTRNSRCRPVRPEDDFVRDIFESREPFQQSLRWNARDVQVEVPMASKQVERRVAP